MRIHAIISNRINVFTTLQGFDLINILAKYSYIALWTPQKKSSSTSGRATKIKRRGGVKGPAIEEKLPFFYLLPFKKKIFYLR